MKAVLIHEFGGPEVLKYEDVPSPDLLPGEILVRIHAIGLNPPDWYLRSGMKELPPEWQPHPDFPIILGSDISGVVEAVANDVKDFSVGDEIYSMMRFPEASMQGENGYAELVTLPASQAALRPKNIDHVHSAAAPMSILTAWQFLIEVGHNEPNPVAPKPHKPVSLNGKTVLVNGAGGGVGHLALQLAKWKGARVIAVASGKHEKNLLALGTDLFLDYHKFQIEQEVDDVDLVIDAVGGAATERFLQIIKKGGALFPIFPLGFDKWDLAEEMGITVSSVQVRSSGTQLAVIQKLLDDGTVKVVIDSVYPLEKAKEAHVRAAEGNLMGKLVLTARKER